MNPVVTPKLRAAARAHVGMHLCLVSSTVKNPLPIAMLVFIAPKRAFVDESQTREMQL